MNKGIIGAALSVLLLAGCSGGGESGESTASTGTAETTPLDREFGSLAELRVALVASGLSCPEWTQENLVAVAAESGACSDSTVLATYATQSDRDTAVSNARAMGRMMSSASIDTPAAASLFGKNWSLRAHADVVAEVQKKMGGIVVA